MSWGMLIGKEMWRKRKADDVQESTTIGFWDFRHGNGWECVFKYVCFYNPLEIIFQNGNLISLSIERRKDQEFVVRFIIISLWIFYAKNLIP